MVLDYNKITEFMIESGKRLIKRTGNISDIGITKKDLTEEDLAIERGFKDIIKSFGDEHIIYAEEENGMFEHSENIWIVDPISGTSNFIKGLPYYAIVIAHLINHKTVFSAVYNPSAGELYTAYTGKGAFLNGERIKVSEGNRKIILRESSQWTQPELVEKIEESTEEFTVEKNTHSMGINYCAVARGDVDGIISMTKDSFPEFAGALIIQEAGGVFTNIEGKSDLNSTDRIFIGGNIKCYNDLFPLVKEQLSINP